VTAWPGKPGTSPTGPPAEALPCDATFATFTENS
jgi:hypothetical protein